MNLEFVVTRSINGRQGIITSKRGRPNKEDQSKISTLRQENDRLREEVKILKKGCDVLTAHRAYSETLLMVVR